MSLFDDTAPANTEGVKLGAQRIREAKTLLNSTLGLLFSAASIFVNNVLPGASIKSNEVTGTQLQSDGAVDANRAVNTNHLKDGAVTAPKLATAAFGDGLNKVLSTDPVTARLDGTTVGFDTSTPKKIKVVDKGIGLVQFADNALAGTYVLVQDEKAPNTAGGTPVILTPFYTVRDINTIKINISTVCALDTTAGANKILLLPGTYRCRISAPGISLQNHRIVLWNATAGDNVLLLSGQNAQAATQGGNAFLTGTFVLPSSGNLVGGRKEVQIRHFAQVNPGSNGLGQAMGGNLSANQMTAMGTPNEVYTVAEFWKDA